MPPARPVALITGASAGIGKELARVLAVDHDLVLTARREDRLQSLASELAPTTCHIFPADLADPAVPRALFGAVKTAGLTIDTLVNNAGVGTIGMFAETELGKTLRMIQVNVTALTELTGLFLPEMRARGNGHILNVGSVAGFQPGPYMAVYFATKAFVNSFTEALSSELQGSGVRVTCLAPGATRSEFATAAGMSPADASDADTRSVAEAGVHGLRKGKRMVIPGFWNRFLLFTGRFAPRGLVIQTAKKMQLARLNRPADGRKV